MGFGNLPEWRKLYVVEMEGLELLQYGCLLDKVSYIDQSSWSLIKRGTERNGTEWKKLIKHGTELLSRHKVLPRTHGSRSYTHANCSCTRRGLLTRLAGNGWEADYSLYSSYIVDKQYS